MIKQNYRITLTAVVSMDSETAEFYNSESATLVEDLFNLVEIDKATLTLEPTTDPAITDWSGKDWQIE